MFVAVTYRLFLPTRITSLVSNNLAIVPVLTKRPCMWINRIIFPLADAGPWFNIKMLSYRYRKSHCGDKTVVRSSYLHNGISYTGKMSSLYWIGAQMYHRIKLAIFFILLHDSHISPRLVLQPVPKIFADYLSHISSYLHCWLFPVNSKLRLISKYSHTRLYLASLCC